MGVIKEALIKARKQIENPQWFCTDWFSKKYGIKCSSLEGDQWDVYGAVHKVCRNPFTIAGCHEILRMAAAPLEPKYVNDFGGHKRVMELYDKAIRMV